MEDVENEWRMLLIIYLYVLIFSWIIYFIYIYWYWNYLSILESNIWWLSPNVSQESSPPEACWSRASRLPISARSRPSATPPWSPHRRPTHVCQPYKRLSPHNLISSFFNSFASADTFHAHTRHDQVDKTSTRHVPS